ncbi:ImmA/IrrE family metallo-endopeptidase [Rhodopseudomonas sp. BR0M22]|uniref:ImmA/IrrE family metallo-endopeptidase n=1 Tax=Rhodopseudomonas sp. BR0M22 TaxID=2269369 RepID=UPI0013DFDBC8|nr:ImmA/IrrE family metallo-endopeptidase [Rhodopseudomonas sp. BR0M22]NEW92141.1 ImmA/IrrE family metallo-endopeptidase [Rhodopseudomonas sp. BR0M22]
MTKFISSVDIDKIALAHRRALGFRDDQAIDGMTLITKLKRRYPNLNYLRVPDAEMTSQEAQWDDQRKLILIPERLLRDINSGKPRGIMTLAHEVGHALLGHKGILNRGPIGTKAEKHSANLRRMESQARRYAAAFLIPDTPYVRSLDAIAIARKFGVSLEAARIRKLEFT